MGEKITVAEVAARYKLSDRTVRRYLHDGLLTAHRIGPHKRMVRLDADEVHTALGGEPIPTDHRDNTNPERS